MKEFDLKLQRLQALLADRQLDALLLRRVSSFAWVTCGAASFVNTAETRGAAALLITRSHRYLITNNIEAPRLEREEGLAAQGWEFCIEPWETALQTIDQKTAELASGLRLGADDCYPGAADLSNPLAHLRANLTPEEGERLQLLGRICAQAMDATARAIRPGQTEHEIAGLLAGETQSRGAQPIVNLVATDERVFAYRHPLPTDKKLNHYAMLVLCGRQSGLVGSITRLVHFGRLPDELRHKAEAVARVDAAMIAATRPGVSLSRVVASAAAAYREVGFPGEWKQHHQGGAAGYEPREYLATPEAIETVSLGQAYAWNPSIRGCKSEDTILVGERENRVLTEISEWPGYAVKIGDETLWRPAILEVL